MNDQPENTNLNPNPTPGTNLSPQPPNPTAPIPNSAPTPAPTPTAPVSPIAPTPVAPDATPVSPISGTVSTPTTPNTTPASQTAPAFATVSSSPAPTTTPVTPTTTPSAAPQNSTNGAKKPNKGLIIGLCSALGALAVVGIIIAVVFLLNRPDPVTAAVNKLLSGDIPANLQIQGNLALSSSADESTSTNCNIGLNSSIAFSDLNNDTNVSLNCESDDLSQPISAELSVKMLSNDALYLKIAGITDLLQGDTSASDISNTGDNDSIITPDDTDCIDTDCIDVEEEIISPDDSTTDEETTDEEIIGEEAIGEETLGEEIIGGEIIEQTVPAFGSFLGSFLELLIQIDGQWLKLPLDETNSTTSVLDGYSACLTSLNPKGVDLSGFYKDNAFLVATTDDVNLASKNFPVYKVTIDETKYNAFLDSPAVTTMISSFQTCMKDYSTSTSAEDFIADLRELPSVAPTFYVEVNKDKQFTRVNWTSDIDGDTLIVDLDLSYPGNINVTAPEDATDLQDLVQNLLMDGSMSSGSSSTLQQKS